MKKDYIIANRYKIIEEIGSGGFSNVYLGLDMRLNTKCAIKIVKNSEFQENLQNEVKMIISLKYWRLPVIYDLVNENDEMCIIEEYIQGKTLEQLLEKEKALSDERAAHIFVQLCEILEYLHNNESGPVIHRDIKPSNIIIADNGDVRLIDFGSARQYYFGKSKDTQLIGTIGYVAPEIVKGEQSDERSDIYSLGITMYQTLTGIDPSNPPYEIKRTDTISKAYYNIIKKCTMSGPLERYKSISEVKTGLLDISNKKHGFKKKFTSAIVLLLLSISLFFNVYASINGSVLSVFNHNSFYFDKDAPLNAKVKQFVGRKVSIKAFNNQYFSYNNSNSKKLYANMNEISDDEILETELIGTNAVAFKTTNGRYLSVPSDGKGAITTSGDKPGTWESFYIQYIGPKENGDAMFCIRTINGYLWTSDISNSGYLYTKSKEMGGGWETFVIRRIDE